LSKLYNKLLVSYYKSSSTLRRAHHILSIAITESTRLFNRCRRLYHATYNKQHLYAK